MPGTHEAASGADSGASRQPIQYGDPDFDEAWAASRNAALSGASRWYP
jgi:hypothetical protein